MSRRLLCVLLVSSTTACAHGGGNRAVATRTFEEILDKGRMELVEELYAPDFRNHGVRRDLTLAEDMESLRRLRGAVPPDGHIKPQLVLTSGEFVTVLWNASGTIAGTLRTFRGITIWRIEDGRIQEEWSSFDQRGMMEALGITGGAPAGGP